MRHEFVKKYRDLDSRMKLRAELDGDVYLPNFEPTEPVDYILVCMEPSLAGWARSPKEATRKVASGFRNFLAGIEPMLLHFSTRRFLCDPGQRYHMTDFSKGAMTVEQAGKARADRYDKWYKLLQEEIKLVAAPGARIIAVGNHVAEHLRRKGLKNFTQVIHYSGQAGRARNARIEGHEDEFHDFKNSIKAEDILSTTLDVLKESKVPSAIFNEAYSIVEGGMLSESRLKLVYCYKLDFEAMKNGN